MAAIRNFAYGGIAIDSIVLSPECRLSTSKLLNCLNFEKKHLQGISINILCR